jgi:predicted RNA binding protein YcfA (HicA-like mRNA interferase family)
MVGFCTERAAAIASASTGDDLAPGTLNSIFKQAGLK